MVSNLVKVVAPDLAEDRHIVESNDSMLWYKIVVATKTLYVPPMGVLKSKMDELDRFAEAVKSFSVADLYSTIYDWVNLNLYEYTGNEDVADALEELHSQMLSKKQGERFLAVDIETRRVEWEDNKLLSIGFSPDPDSSIAVYNCDWFDPEVRDALQRLLNDKSITFIWQNGKFDCTRLKYLVGIDARVDQDTMLMHYIGINEKQGTHGLKHLGQLYLQAPPWEDELDKVKRGFCKQNKILLSEFMYDQIPTRILIPYMQRDTIATYRLYTLFETLMRPESRFIYSKLIKGSEVYMNMELNGQQIDTQYLYELRDNLNTMICEARERFNEAVGHVWDPIMYMRETGSKCKPNEPFNVKSPKQLGWLLSKIIGRPVTSTNMAVINDLLEEYEGTEKSDVLSALVDVRKYQKYMDTYVSGLSKLICRDGRIRSSFNMHGTETGRLSSSSPNMQNIPRNKLIKNLIVAPIGHKLVQFDYSQIELRVLAVLSGDTNLLNIYKEGKDLHDTVTDLMYGEGAHKDKEKRVRAKTVNFGIAYGRGSASIANMFRISKSEAQGIIDQWFRSMPGVKKFIDERRRMGSVGAPCVTMFGRERHFVITRERMYHIQNEYINTPIQSIASDLTMLSLLEIYDYLKTHWNGLAKLITTIHDSIMLEVVDDPHIIKKVIEGCVSIMESVPPKYIKDCPIPFLASVDEGYKWGEMD